MIEYRDLTPDELTPNLFRAFIRKQIVTDCWRRENGKWVIRSDPFVDDWNEKDYDYLVICLQNTLATNGFVGGAFVDGILKGFVSVEGKPIGSRGQYLDLSSIHVSADLRGQGIGRELFRMAKQFAKGKQAEKLYMSTHSAVESQAFYKAMGCVEAEEYQIFHVEKEPFDCQLECRI